MLTKKQAKSLAVAYSAFNRACREENKPDEKFWAEFLDDVQRETGVVLMDHLDMYYHRREPA